MRRRAVNLNFFTLYFPITAWVSILHRLSGCFVFLCVPCLLWLFQYSTTSKAHFLELKVFFLEPLVRFTLWLLFSALLYHFIAGMRHLLFDMAILESKLAGSLSAKITLCLVSISMMGIGVWLW
jgi:succinate dehydrogenase / fumarate reductase cytochrome b subunit